MNIIMRYATSIDAKAIKVIDSLSLVLLNKAIMENRVILILDDEKVIGALRFGYFWEIIPMINFIYIDSDYRNQGLGRKLHSFFKNEMKKQGLTKLMTTTQIDENGQYFFRKIGYIDHGSFSFSNQADELILLMDVE